MTMLDDHRKRLAFSRLSSELNFKKTEIMINGDIMVCSFECNAMRFTAEMSDRKWRFRSIKPSSSLSKVFSYDLDLDSQLIIEISDCLPQRAAILINQQLECNIASIMSTWIYTTILTKLKIDPKKISEIQYRKVLMPPTEENPPPPVIFIDNPSVGFEFFALAETNGALVLYYKLTKNAKKSASAYDNLITDIAYQYADLVTADLYELHCVF